MITRVLLADDHAMIRHAISSSISRREDIEVVGQCCDGLMAVKLAAELVPDIILMDISMPYLNGFEATREILRNHPQIKIIALSMHSSKQFVTEMLKAGACGYLLKDCEFDELINAISVVASGRTYLSPSISSVIIDSFVTPQSKDSSTAFSRLSQRERQILQLLAEGNSTKQIANLLFVSPKTVEAHRLNLMNKLSIGNMAQLTKYAIQEGLTNPEL